MLQKIQPQQIVIIFSNSTSCAVIFLKYCWPFFDTVFPGMIFQALSTKSLVWKCHFQRCCLSSGPHLVIECQDIHLYHEKKLFENTGVCFHVCVICLQTKVHILPVVNRVTNYAIFSSTNFTRLANEFKRNVEQVDIQYGLSALI